MQGANIKYSISDVVTNTEDLNSSFAYGTLCVAYCGLNTNHTNISKEAFESSVTSMYNCPIVAYYDADDDYLGGHDQKVVTYDDEDDNEKKKIIELTEPVGVIPESATYRWETREDNGEEHEYFCIDNVILWKRQPCFQKILDNQIIAMSMEISIGSGTVTNNILNIDSFEFRAFCLLGDEMPCFEQASLQLLSLDNFKSQWSQMLKELEKFSTKTGGVEKMEDEKKKLDEQIDEPKVQKDKSIVDDPAAEEQVEPNDEPINEPEEEPKEPELPPEPKPIPLTMNERRCALKRAMNGNPEFIATYLHDFTECELYVYNFDYDKFYSYHYDIEGTDAIICVDSKKEKRLTFVDAIPDGESEVAMSDLIKEIANDKTAQATQEHEAEVANLNEQINELQEYKDNKIAEKRQEDELALFSSFDAKLKNSDEYHQLKANASKYSLNDLEKECFALVGKISCKFSKENTMAARVPVTRDNEENDNYGGLLKNKKMI